MTSRSLCRVSQLLFKTALAASVFGCEAGNGSSDESVDSWADEQSAFAALDAESAAELDAFAESDAPELLGFEDLPSDLNDEEAMEYAVGLRDTAAEANANGTSELASPQQAAASSGMRCARAPRNHAIPFELCRPTIGQSTSFGKAVLAGGVELLWGSECQFIQGPPNGCVNGSSQNFRVLLRVPASGPQASKLFEISFPAYVIPDASMLAGPGLACFGVHSSTEVAARFGLPSRSAMAFETCFSRDGGKRRQLVHVLQALEQNKEVMAKVLMAATAAAGLRAIEVAQLRLDLLATLSTRVVGGMTLFMLNFVYIPPDFGGYTEPGPS